MRSRSGQEGFTLIELMLVVAIIATLAAIAIPMMAVSVRLSRQERAVQDLRILEMEIQLHEFRNGRLPADLAEIQRDNLRDPWGRPYHYLNIDPGVPRGDVRKDRFLVPLNSDFDLYSAGPDGLTRPALTARVSRDDILRANNGTFFGVAADY